MRARKIGASILVVIAAVLFLLSSFGWWAKRYFLDSETFSDKATQIVDRPEVQVALATAITDQITEASGREVDFAQPFVTTIVEKVVESTAFQDVFSGAVLRLHRAVVGDEAREAILDLSPTVDRVKTALEPVAPNLADEIPSGNEVELRILDRSQLDTVYDVTKVVETTVWVLTALTVLCFAAGIALSPRRWRTAAFAGWVTFGVFVVSLLAVRIGRSATGSLSDRAEYGSAAQAAYKVITHGLQMQGLVFAILGLLVAVGAGWTDRHGGWAAVTAAVGRGVRWVRAQMPERRPAPVPVGADGLATTADEHPSLGTTVTGALAPRLPPPGRRPRAAHGWRAAGLLVLGLFAVFSPDSLTTLVVVLLGLAALYLAVTEAVAAWGSPKEPPPSTEPALVAATDAATGS